MESLLQFFTQGLGIAQQPSREWGIRVALSAIFAGVLQFLDLMAVSLLLLLFVMICDYATGMIAAWVNKTLSSKTGLLGIVKKLCYFFAIFAAAGIDWLIGQALQGVSISLPIPLATLVLFWFVINEVLSILENLCQIGVPLPTFFKTIADRLKVQVEEQGKLPK